MRRLLRFVLPLGVLAALTLAPPAAATHNQDKHSANMSLVFSSPNPTRATNTDIAFWGNRAYFGDIDGVRIFDISNPAAPVLLGRLACTGSQNDPVVWENRLLFTAVDSVRAGPQCGTPAATIPSAPGGWEGVRIFDVSNPAAPQQIGSVYTDCGAHTITLHPAPAAGMLHLYVSSYPLGSGPTCGDTEGPRAGRSPVHGVIQVIEVPLSNPAGAREIAEPPITYPGDPDNQFMPSQHGLTFPEPAMRACHDISVYVPLNVAVAACVEQAQMWRIGPNGIPDTQNPIWVVDDRQDANGATGNPADPDVAVDFWHSATMTWDGKLVNFIDESFGGGCPTQTNITEPGVAGMSDTGRMFFYRANGSKLSHFQIPRPETPPADNYCSAHLGNVAPAIGRYLLVNAWYTGGVDLVDFTNPAAPSEVAFYDLATTATAVGGDNWSHYWYENTPGDDTGFWSYATHGVEQASAGQGAQVYRTTGMNLTDVAMRRLNPQTQEDVITCTVRASGALRVGRATHLAISVRTRNGVAVIGGQAIRGVRVTLRGAGISRSATTNTGGMTRVRVRPTRRGTLRIAVQNDENLIGCRTQRGVAAAAAGGGRLTGSR
jgi:hypothetical protein